MQNNEILQEYLATRSYAAIALYVILLHVTLLEPPGFPRKNLVRTPLLEIQLVGPIASRGRSIRIHILPEFYLHSSPDF